LDLKLFIIGQLTQPSDNPFQGELKLLKWKKKLEEFCICIEIKISSNASWLTYVRK